MSKRRGILAVVWIVVIVGVVSIPFVCATRTIGRYNCLQCRLVKRFDSTWYSSQTDYEPNSCSEWYSQEVPDHEHQWRAVGCWSETQSIPLLYSSTGLRCHIMRFDSLSPEMQREFLANTDKSQWEPFFRLLEEDFHAAWEICYKASMERQ